MGEGKSTGDLKVSVVENSQTFLFLLRDAASFHSNAQLISSL